MLICKGLHSNDYYKMFKGAENYNFSSRTKVLNIPFKIL